MSHGESFLARDGQVVVATHAPARGGDFWSGAVTWATRHLLD
jgi:hypothetical protein